MVEYREIVNKNLLGYLDDPRQFSIACHAEKAVSSYVNLQPLLEKEARNPPLNDFLPVA
jgi:hypothetical protein